MKSFFLFAYILISIAGVVGLIFSFSKYNTVNISVTYNEPPGCPHFAAATASITFILTF